jgi:uncharacterized protein
MVAEPVVLAPWECESLLRSQVVGRVGMTTPEGPSVLPVNYSVVDGTIWMRTAPDSQLGRITAGTVVALEIDEFDHGRHRGWSVLARGPAAALSEPDVVAHLERVWPPRPWAWGDKPTYVGLRWVTLTGLKLGAGWDPRHQTEVRRTV